MTSTVKAASSERASPAVWIALIGVGLLLLMLAIASQDSVDLGGRADPRGSGPEGMLAARMFVEQAGGSVELDVYVPTADIDVAILPREELSFFDSAQVEAENGDDDNGPRVIESWDPLLAWVAGGGVLITEQDVPQGPSARTNLENLDDLERLEPGICNIASLEGVEAIAPRSYIPVGVDGDRSCFGSENGALVVTATVGDGLIVRIATLEPFFNQSFGEANNGAFFARLVDIDTQPRVGFLPEAPIRFLENPDGQFELDDAEAAAADETADEEGDADSVDGQAAAGGDGDGVIADGDGNAASGDGTGSGTTTRGDPLGGAGTGQSGLFDLIPDSVLALLAGLVGSAALFAYAKSRRHGSPVEEEIPIELPSSSFVEALGRLYQRAENPTARSSAIMRENLRTNLTRRAGMPTNTSAEEIADTLAGPDQKAAVRQLLEGPNPVRDDDFVALARELAETAQRIDRGGLASLSADDLPPLERPVLTPKGTSS